ncbi:MAG: hypothetical protein IJS12_00890 [Lachnospiraceae bacterium]|nr:hypothetical protein [Lachnospiraceae bacterium]
MKNKVSRVISILLAAVMITICAIAFPIQSEAAEMTFSGTVADKTTSDLLYLSTSGGVMEIKIDSSTDLSTAKFLLPGYKVSCVCTVGSDEYWHASKITGSSSVGSASVDTSKQYTVTGTLAKGTNEEVLFLKMSDGTMELKLDPSTDTSGVRAFTMGKSLKVVCSRGSDAYMHALSISDNGGGSSAVSIPAGNIDTSSSGVTATSQTYNATGKVDKSTTSSVLYLNANEGQYQIKLDSGVNNSACHVLMPGQSVTVSFFRGSDEWLHAVALVNNASKQASTTTLDPNQLTVSGTIDKATTESTLYLATSGGTMQIRMDGSTNYAGCPFLLKDKSVQVICQRGADEYYHAVSITSK